MERKLVTHDWAMRVCLTLLGICILDEWLLHRGARGPAACLLQNQFYEQLETELIDNTLDTSGTRQRSIPESASADALGHSFDTDGQAPALIRSPLGTAHVSCVLYSDVSRVLYLQRYTSSWEGLLVWAADRPHLLCASHAGRAPPDRLIALEAACRSGRSLKEAKSSAGVRERGGGKRRRCGGRWGKGGARLAGHPCAWNVGSVAVAVLLEEKRTTYSRWYAGFT